EELPLVVERVAAGLRGIEEEQDSVRDVGERRDRLALHRVPLRHRSIEEARGVEDLETLHPPVEVTDRNPFRGEGVVRDLRSTGGDRPDKGTLPHVRIACDHDRPQGGVDLREPSEGATGLGERLEIRSGPVAVALAARPKALSSRPVASRTDGSSNTGRRNRPHTIRVWAVKRGRIRARRTRSLQGSPRDSGPRGNSRSGTCSAPGPSLPG